MDQRHSTRLDCNCTIDLVKWNLSSFLWAFPINYLNAVIALGCENLSDPHKHTHTNMIRKFVRHPLADKAARRQKHRDGRHPLLDFLPRDGSF